MPKHNQWLILEVVPKLTPPQLQTHSRIRAGMHGPSPSCIFIHIIHTTSTVSQALHPSETFTSHHFINFIGTF